MSASFSITIQGKGTFTASIADPEASVTVGTNTPASFTAEVAPVGPAGAAGATGATGATGAAGTSGVVYATAPILYNSGTQTVSIDPDYKPNPFNQTLNTSSDVEFNSILSTVGGFGTVSNGVSITANGARFRASDPAASKASEYAGTGITFSDASVQTTAFPPAGGTTAQYIDGTGALETFPAVGDRYLTSSTSTLTINNGNGKTMTISAGLSYSSQQDITVSYDASHHMHGTVVSYDSTTGVMVFDSNQHTGTGTFSAWEVNVGGVAGAILPVGGTAGQVLSKINSTNFNTEWVSLDYAPLASPTFTGNPIAPTPTAGDNDTSIATTAFVNTYCPSASTTTAGKVELATTAEALAGTDTARAVTPEGLEWANGSDIIFDTTSSNAYSSASSGTSAALGNTNGLAKFTTSASVTGFTRMNWATLFHTTGKQWNSSYDFSKRFTLDGSIGRVNGTDTTNIAGWLVVGDGGTVTSNVAPNDQSFGLKIVGADIYGYVHNGTTLSLSASAILASSTSSIMYNFRIISDGAGNVSFYINGTFITTMTGGPTALIATAFRNAIAIKTITAGTITGSPMTIYFSKLRLRIS
jgi:hypothetical protein